MGAGLTEWVQAARRAAPGCRLIEAQALEGGLSATITALTVQDAEGRRRRMVVRQPGGVDRKQNQQAVQDAFRLLELLQTVGVAAPAPLGFELSGEVSAAPYLIMEYLDGKPEYAPADRVGYAQRAAQELAVIHAANAAHLDLSFLPKSEEIFAAERNRRRPSMNSAMQEEDIRAALERALPLPQVYPPALLHGDYWQGNLLWNSGRLVGIVDWEDAAVGDPLMDLAISRWDFLWILGFDAFNTFTNAYAQSTTVNLSSLPYWDLYAALRFVRLAGDNLDDWAAFFHPFGRTDITKGTIQNFFRFFLQQAFQKIE